MIKQTALNNIVILLTRQQKQITRWCQIPVSTTHHWNAWISMLKMPNANDQLSDATVRLGRYQRGVYIQ